MHILEEDQGVINDLLRDHTLGSKLTQLKIFQCLQLDQPRLGKVMQCIRQGNPKGQVVLPITRWCSQSPGDPGGPGNEWIPIVEPGLPQELDFLFETEAGYRGDRPASGWVQGGGTNHKHTVCIPVLLLFIVVPPISAKETRETKGRT